MSAEGAPKGQAEQVEALAGSKKPRAFARGFDFEVM